MTKKVGAANATAQERETETALCAAASPQRSVHWRQECRSPQPRKYRARGGAGPATLADYPAARAPALNGCSCQ